MCITYVCKVCNHVLAKSANASRMHFCQPGTLGLGLYCSSRCIMFYALFCLRYLNVFDIYKIMLCTTKEGQITSSERRTGNSDWSSGNGSD